MKTINLSAKIKSNNINKPKVNFVEDFKPKLILNSELKQKISFKNNIPKINVNNSKILLKLSDLKPRIDLKLSKNPKIVKCE